MYAIRSYYVLKNFLGLAKEHLGPLLLFVLIIVKRGPGLIVAGRRFRVDVKQAEAYVSEMTGDAADIFDRIRNNFV